MDAQLRAPAVRTRRKATRSEGAEARALRAAMWAWRDTPIWIPVVWDRRCLGVVRGDPRYGRTLWHPWSAAFPYADYDDAVAQKSAGKHWATYWTKPVRSSVVVDNWYDLWGLDGNPIAGDWSGTARTARPFTGPLAAGIPTGGAVSPALKYVTRSSLVSIEQTVYTMLLYDRVLSYDKCTMSASSQSMTNTLPATRYVSVGDPGLQVFVEADAAHNSTAANLTVLTYVDQAGTAGHVVPTSPTLALIVSAAAPSSTLGARCVIQTPGVTTKSANPYLTLQPGDQGVSALTNYTFSAAPTGTNSFVLQFPLALFPDHATAGSPSDYEFVSGIEAVNKRIYDDACLSWLLNPHVTTESMLHGWLEFGW